MEYIYGIYGSAPPLSFLLRRAWAMLRIFVNTNFHESAILRYFASTYICESIVFANRTSSNFSRGLNYPNFTKISEIREN